MRSLAIAIFLGCALVAGVIYESGAPERYALAQRIAQEESRLANAKAGAAESIRRAERRKVEALEKQEAERAEKEAKCQRIEDMLELESAGERSVGPGDRIWWFTACQDLRPSDRPAAAGSEHD